MFGIIDIRDGFVFYYHDKKYDAAVLLHDSEGNVYFFDRYSFCHYLDDNIRIVFLN